MAVCKVIPVCAIIHDMKKTILIAGKNLPDGKKLAGAFSKSGRTVMVAAETNNMEESESIIDWNRSSAVSARAVVLEAENRVKGLNEAVLYFDEDFLAKHQGKIDAEECSRNADEQIVSWQYLAFELLSRFEKTYLAKSGEAKPGKIVFLLKEGISGAESVKNPALRNGVNAVSGPLVSAAKAAFECFAESVAALYGDRESVNIVLAKAEAGSEIAATDETLGSWLSEYLDSVDELKSKLSAKKSISWVKAGAKGASSSVFGLFGSRR